MKDREEYISILEQDNAELKKQVEDLLSENRNLRKKLENCMTFEDYKYTLNKKIKLETQQKEFIKYLEDEIKELQKNKETELDYDLLKDVTTQLLDYKDALQKYKEIIGVSDENKKGTN